MKLRTAPAIRISDGIILTDLKEPSSMASELMTAVSDGDRVSDG